MFSFLPLLTPGLVESPSRKICLGDFFLDAALVTRIYVVLFVPCKQQMSDDDLGENWVVLEVSELILSGCRGVCHR